MGENADSSGESSILRMNDDCDAFRPGKAIFPDKEGEKKVRKNLLFGNLIINLPSVLCGKGEVYGFVWKFYF